MRAGARSRFFHPFLAGLVAAAAITMLGQAWCRAQPASPQPDTDRAPSMEELKNATYAGFDEPTGPVPLREGRWAGEPYEKGAAVMPLVTFVRDFRLVGDLDGDGGEEAAVLLAQNSGGSGEFVYLAAVGRRDGAPRNLATGLLGDRVKVRAGRIEGRRIVLDVVQAGAGDARCCPGDLVTRSWELQGGTLKERAPEHRGRLTPDALAGTEWVLRSWTMDETAAPEPAVTLRFENGRFAGTSGCNQYTASVTTGTMPGDLAVGPAAGTRMMCPEPAMAMEARFLRNLGSVTKFSFMAGQLVLTHGQGGAMFFDPAPAR